jgi:hypothetical protein
MSDEAARSTPPPGAEELAAAGVPEGGLQATAPPAAAVPDDAKDTRGKHLKALFRNVWVLGLTWTIAIIVLIAAGTQAGFGVGAAGAGVVLVIALVVVWFIASGRAAGDFFNAYADGRGLTRVGDRSSLPPVTDLLRKGDRRYTEELFNGTLPGGLVGSLALYTYEEISRDSKGNRQTTYYHFTVAVTQLPETAPFLSELALQRRFGFRFLDSAEDVFRSRQRVEVESELADKKFEIFTGKGDDMNRARQVFTPTFVVWLGEEAHEGIAFELSAGALVVNIKGHKKTAHELDAFCEGAAVVARRLHEEAVE